MKRNRIIYLIQGQAKLVKNYFNLSSRPNSDAIFLTYDEKIDGAIFFPKSTWSEGRNHMLLLAKEKNDYLYYVFCDDDIGFIKGDWDIFENELFELLPAIGVPIVQKTRHSVIPFLRYQTFYQNDEQLVAFHKDVISDQILFPYRSEFDKIHWWAACLIQQTLIQNFYHYVSIQFNRVRISNDCHVRYFNGKDPEDDSFKLDVSKWLRTQFRAEYLATSKAFYRRILEIMRDTRIFMRNRMTSRIQDYRIPSELVNEKLNDRSILLSNWKASKL